MPNRQTQTQPPKGRPNPATTAPEDDELQESAGSPATEVDPRQARDRRGDDGTNEPNLEIENEEDADSDEDDDEEDGSGARI